MEQWREIDSAPKGDGTRIIAWDPNYWGPGDGTSGEAIWYGLSNRWKLLRSTGSRFNPTHWIPMPEPSA